MTFLSLALRHWKLVGIGLLALLLTVQTVRLGAEKNRSERLEIANNELRFELKRISSAKAEQKRETAKRIEIAEHGNREADEIAKKIEQAPLEPGACKTPAEILQEPML
jgi:septal ring factor EnvC (AmiA/AmiB activator)